MKKHQDLLRLKLPLSSAHLCLPAPCLSLTCRSCSASVTSDPLCSSVLRLLVTAVHWAGRTCCLGLQACFLPEGCVRQVFHTAPSSWKSGFAFWFTPWLAPVHHAWNLLSPCLLVKLLIISWSSHWLSPFICFLVCGSLRAGPAPGILLSYIL